MAFARVQQNYDGVTIRNGRYFLSFQDHEVPSLVSDLRDVLERIRMKRR